MTLTDKELTEIAERVKLTPGTWHPDGCGAPVVHLGYGERLLNMLPKTDLYMRRKRGEDYKDELERCVKINEQLKPLFAPAYQAHQDVTVLLEEVQALRERLGQTESLLRRFMDLHLPVQNDTLCWRTGEERLMLDIGDYLHRREQADAIPDSTGSADGA
jgi:hypothetical protein